ncbi:MAG: prolyl oligopeptidase family serine peptidase [Terriglobales bacterium]
MRARMLALLLLALLSTAPLAAKETGFLNRSVTVAGVTYRYQVYVPVEWTAKTKWPVILSLHGAGERGSDGLFSTENGLGRALRRNAKAFPFVAVFPQCPLSAMWVDRAMQEMAMAALESAIKEFGGDRQRLYLTGLSMGGYGTWEMAMRYPKYFAAIAPVCGAIQSLGGMYPELRSHMADLNAKDPYADAAKKMAGVPAWIFHGAKDPLIPVTESRRMAEALRAAGSTVRYSEYPEATHNSWDRAYAEPELVKWLLEQRRK